MVIKSKWHFFAQMIIHIAILNLLFTTVGFKIGSLTAEHKATFSLVFSDIKQRQNIAGR